jgi:hypothetical protein
MVATKYKQISMLHCDGLRQHLCNHYQFMVLYDPQSPIFGPKIPKIHNFSLKPPLNAIEMVATKYKQISMLHGDGLRQHLCNHYQFMVLYDPQSPILGPKIPKIHNFSLKPPLNAIEMLVTNYKQISMQHCDGLRQ